MKRLWRKPNDGGYTWLGWWRYVGLARPYSQSWLLLWQTVLLALILWRVW
jgi:hypothetical protein